MEELTSVVRDFGRHIVELTKPQDSFLARNKWVIIIAGVLIGGLALMFAPAILEQIKAGFGGVGGSITKAAGGAIKPVP